MAGQWDIGGTLRISWIGMEEGEGESHHAGEEYLPHLRQERQPAYKHCGRAASWLGLGQLQWNKDFSKKWLRNSGGEMLALWRLQSGPDIELFKAY